MEISSTMIDKLELKINNVQSNTIKIEEEPDLSMDFETSFFELASKYGLDHKQIDHLLDSLGLNFDNLATKRAENTLASQTIPQNPPQFLALVGDDISKVINNEDLWQEVIKLEQEGYEAKEIAKKLDRGQGEINLLLNLTRKSSAI